MGRDGDLRMMQELFEDTQVRGGALMVTGEPGVGKTALLESYAAESSARGTRIFWASGVEFEADVSYSGLNQLLFPLHDFISELGTAHSEALSVALGFGSGPAPDRLLVSNAALLLLRQIAAKQPLLLVVDDLPWLDRASAAVLSFVARRLIGSRISFLGAARSNATSFFEGSGMITHELPPLDGAAAEELVCRHFPGLAPSVRKRLLNESGGNPLALMELPTALTGSQRHAVTSLPAVLPLTQRLKALFTSRVSVLPEPCRRLLLLGALDRSGGRDALRTLAVERDIGSLAPAERDHLIHVDAPTQRFVFRHPLIRSAVVEASTIGERRTAHRELAAVLVEHPERRAWHLGESATGPDNDTASLLEEAARLAQRRGDATSAIASLIRAADLSPASSDRGRRLAEAAYIGTESVGELRGASHLLDEARRTSPIAGASLHAATATSLLLINDDGDVLHAYKLLLAAVDAADHGYDSGNAALVEALYALLLLCWFAGRRELWEPVVAAIDRLTPEVPDLLWILSRTFPDPARTGQAAAEVLDAMLADLHAGSDPTRIARLGTASVYLDRLAGAREGNWHLVHEGRQGHAAARRYAAALMHLCHDTFHTGQWETMAELADEGLRLCDDHGYRFFAWYFRYMRSLHATVRGDHVTSQAMTDELVRWSAIRGARGVEWFAVHPRALNYIGQCNYEAAFQEATRYNPPGIIASHIPHAMWTAIDLVESAQRTGRHAEASAHAVAMREADLPSLSSRLHLLTAGATAMVADTDRYRELFDTALDLPDNDTWPFDTARIRIAYGERLRRARATAPARTQLSLAASAFQTLGAAPWYKRAVEELRATGLSRPRNVATRFAGLTPKEREIAELAGLGLTNKQIGQRLYLSPRTVGTHLYKVFPKLGITSRAALRDALTRLNDVSDADPTAPRPGLTSSGQ
ncbi:helix-turn-helix transcriptional regulator [Streptomyces sp. WAC 01325]|uniref:helix-turn-helix transcriptional regulator n=1 Tax=Streptomyces sp. WAC 01325 TaxID=2203202 RepID=UPI0021AF6702|nr:LuxR family transcriptional regulator [Streptomyces sp. WAC 01325]